MSDLIDRQAAIDALSTPHGILYPIRIVEELPAVQPQQIVRCKDCKYWMRENISDGYCSEMNMGDCGEDFYCGYAEVLTMEEFMDGQDMGNPEDGSL